MKAWQQRIESIERDLRALRETRQAEPYGRIARVPEVEAAAAVDVKVFRLRYVNAADWVTGQIVDARTGIIDTSKDYNIAKPYLLRAPVSRLEETYSDYTSGYTRRKATRQGAPTKDEVITPLYRVGDYVLAIKLPWSVTGVLSVDWIDLNVDGRQWMTL